MKKQHAVILIGATGGIGQAFAKKLHDSGKPVVLVGRNIEKLSRLEKKLIGEGGAPVFKMVCDISDAKSRENLLLSISALPVTVDMLINNAGINNFGLFDQQSDEVVTKQIEVNAISPLLMIKTLMPYFLSLDVNVQVVNVGSTFGDIAYPGFAAYSASKFALKGGTEALMREYADTNIRFRYFAPRATQTELNSDAVVQMNEVLKVHMDSPEKVSCELMKFLQNKKLTQYLGWPEKLFVYINRLFPGVVSGELKKSLPVIREYAMREY